MSFYKMINSKSSSSSDHTASKREAFLNSKKRTRAQLRETHLPSASKYIGVKIRDNTIIREDPNEEESPPKTSKKS
jgi:hypothetical protein